MALFINSTMRLLETYIIYILKIPFQPLFCFINFFVKSVAIQIVSFLNICYWASEASPTLGCSIETSRDILYIYVGLYVHHMPKCVGRITLPKHAHAQSQFWAVKTDL